MKALFNASPINWSHPLNRGLLRWWLCLPQRHGGGRWRELTRKSDATITGATVAGSRGRPGGWGCYEYDGVNDYATPGAFDLTALATITLSFWTYHTAGTSSQHVYESSASSATNANAMLFAASPGSTTCQVRIRQAASNCNGNFSIPDASTWTHYVVTCDLALTSPFKVYANGVPLSVSHSGSNTATSFGNYTWRFMSRNGTTFFATGKLDDFRMYNRILSASEALELYRESKSGYRRLLRWIESPLATFASQGVANSYWAWNTYGAVA